MAIMRLVCVFMLAVMVWPVSGCSKEKSNPKAVDSQNVSNSVDTHVSRKLSVVSTSFLSAEKERAARSSHESSSEFSKDGTGMVFIEPFEGKVRAVHNGKTGKAYAEIFNVMISSDGKRVAYTVRDGSESARMVIDGKEGFGFGPNDNHGFTPDGKHHLSTVSRGDDKYVVIDGKASYDYHFAEFPLVSSDSRSMAFSAKSPVGNGKQFIIADLNLQNKAVFDSCGENYMSNDDKTQLAVVCSEGKNRTVKVIDFTNRRVLSSSQLNGTLTRWKFAADNRSLSYTVVRDGEHRYIVHNGREEMIPAGDEFFSDPLVLAEPAGVGAIIGTVYTARFYRAFQKQHKNGKEYGYISDFVSSRDLRSYAYVATDVNDEKMHIVINDHAGPKFDKIVAPVFSPDGRTVVYRAREAGKRFIVVSDGNGKILSRHRAYDMVFQPAFTADGTSVTYGVLDGNEFWWKVEKL